jgi:ribosomal protein L2
MSFGVSQNFINKQNEKFNVESGLFFLSCSKNIINFFIINKPNFFLTPIRDNTSTMMLSRNIDDLNKNNEINPGLMIYDNLAYPYNYKNPSEYTYLLPKLQTNLFKYTLKFIIIIYKILIKLSLFLIKQYLMKLYKYAPLYKTAPKTFTNFKYILQKCGVTSGGSRLSFKFKRFLPINLKVNQLLLRIKKYAGRCNSGRITVFTKHRTRSTLLTYALNYKFRFRKISFIASITILPFSHKLVSLIFSSTGSISYIPTTYTQSLFKNTRMYKLTTNIMKLKNKLDVNSKYRFITQTIFLLKQLPRNQKISLLELLPGEGIKYIRSPGTSGHLIKVNQKLNSALVKMPSGVRKVFSIFSLGSLGINPLYDNKY